MAKFWAILTSVKGRNIHTILTEFGLSLLAVAKHYQSHFFNQLFNSNIFLKKPPNSVMG
jgi:hypothetical protein